MRSFYFLYNLESGSLCILRTYIDFTLHYAFSLFSVVAGFDTYYVVITTQFSLGAG